MPLSDEELFAALDAAVAAFTALPIERGDVPVPACPGWTLSDLFDHQGHIHRWATLIVTTRPDERPHRDDRPLPAGADRAAYLAEGAAALRSALAGADLDAVTWTFTGPAPDALVAAAAGARDDGPRRRRRGGAGPGVRRRSGGGGRRCGRGVRGVRSPPASITARSPAPGETAHLHATDAAGEWLLRFAPETLEVTHEHAKGDVAARGPAGDLLRLVWGRAPGEALTVFGDEGLLDRYRAAARY